MDDKQVIIERIKKLGLDPEDAEALVKYVQDNPLDAVSVGKVADFLEMAGKEKLIEGQYLENQAEAAEELLAELKKRETEELQKSDQIAGVMLSKVTEQADRVAAEMKAGAEVTGNGGTAPV